MFFILSRNLIFQDFYSECWFYFLGLYKIIKYFIYKIVYQCLKIMLFCICLFLQIKYFRFLFFLFCFMVLIFSIFWGFLFVNILIYLCFFQKLGFGISISFYVWLEQYKVRRGYFFWINFLFGLIILSLIQFLLFLVDIFYC